MPDIMHLVHLDVPVQQVWSAIATADGVRRWWTDDADFDGRVGGWGEFRFYDGGRVTRVEVMSFEAPTRTGWRVSASFRPEWVGTMIEFELSPDGDGTCLRFAHRGFPAADDDYAVCTTGWGIYLGRLAAALTPHLDPPVTPDG